MTLNRSALAFLLFLLLLTSACTPVSTGGQIVPSTTALVNSALTPPVEILPSATPQPTATPTLEYTPTPTLAPTPTPAVLVGAGDIAFCGDAPEYQGDERTADLIEDVLAEYPEALVFAAGDVVYGDGRLVEYQNCFGPSWGRFLERVRPVPGNHDYTTDGGAPYFTYFGEAAGPAGQGFYSYDLGDWHIVALNSNCDNIACGPNSAQVAWLREDLQSHPSKCTLAYWHHPRFSSGLAGGSGIINPFWRAAYDLGVDVVVNGHDHNYERFGPLNVEGEPDPQGVRMFVAGTGGGLLRDFGTPQPNSEVRYSGVHGVLQFKLYPDRYEWTFLPVEDSASFDSGSGACR